MSRVSFLEDIVERFDEAAGLLGSWVGSPGSVSHWPDPPIQHQALEELRQAASHFLTYYNEYYRRAGLTPAEWGRHFDDLKALNEILLEVEPLTESGPQTRNLLNKVAKGLFRKRGHRKRLGIE